MGNHEFYQYNIESTKKIILSNLPDNIYLLDNNTIQIDDVYFHGATLWTDFRKNDPLVMYEVKQKMNDYKCIRHTHNYKRIQPYDIYNIHQFSKEYIATKLAENKEKKNVVITHHAPCQLSIPERYKNEILLNHGFYSDLSDLILDANPNIWVHGHIHSNSNYTLGDTRVICNPKGSHNENPNFNLELCVEI
jgi:Icc-related predicted phosphoesterase